MMMGGYHGGGAGSNSGGGAPNGRGHAFGPAPSAANGSVCASPGPSPDVYAVAAADHAGYAGHAATSPQPMGVPGPGFQAVAINRVS